MAIAVFKNCWVCGRFGSPFIGSRRICNNHPEGPVTWMYNAVAEKPLTKEIMWRSGQVIECVDFTKPNAPSSPA